jgi:Flp pilus assembly protein TadG
MQRLRERLGEERGAVNVMVALLMVSMMGFMSIAVDAAAMWSDKQQLQTGADAGALAVAQDCALGTCDEATSDQTATRLAVANKNDGSATGDAVLASGKVTVHTATERQHWFASVLGFNSSTIRARATAGWGGPSGGTAVLPMTFSKCEWDTQTGGGMPSGTTEHTIKFTKSSGTSCTGPSGNVVPGGFGWLNVNSGTCNIASLVADILWSSSGNSVPSGCTSEDFRALRGATVLLPIFSETGDSGSNAWYKVHGYAAFTITGYYFADSKFRWNDPCAGNERCIRGYFTQYVELSDRFSYGSTAPSNLPGAYVSRLELDEGTP